MVVGSLGFPPPAQSENLSRLPNACAARAGYIHNGDVPRSCLRPAGRHELAPVLDPGQRNRHGVQVYA